MGRKVVTHAMEKFQRFKFLGGGVFFHTRAAKQPEMEVVLIFEDDEKEDATRLGLVGEGEAKK